MSTPSVPTIRVIGFRQSYEKDDKGKTVPVDWVEWVPVSSPQSTSNNEKVRRLDPSRVHLPEGADGGEKLAYMRTIWAQIEPAYIAWKEGREVPVNGTPLAAWPGITPEQAEVLRLSGIRTVEEVANMGETLRSKVRLPNVRDLQQLAALYLENSGAAAAAELAAAKDRQIAEMKEQIEAMQELLAEHLPKSGADKSDDAEADEPGDEIEALRGELDKAGIEYDRRWGIAKLRALLEEKDGD